MLAEGTWCTLFAMSNPKKKKPVNATASKHKGYQLPARVDDHLKGLLQRVAKKDRRKVGPMVAILLEEAIKARGEWDDPPDASGRQE